MSFKVLQFHFWLKGGWSHTNMLYLSGSQQETDGTLKIGKFQEGLFTKGLFITCGCWGTTRDRSVTWGLLEAKLLSFLSPKEWEGKKVRKSSSVISDQETQQLHRLPERKRARGIGTRSPLPPSVSPGLPNNSKIGCVLSSRNQTQLEVREHGKWDTPTRCVDLSSINCSYSSPMLSPFYRWGNRIKLV